MSQGTFSDKLIRLKAFKIIFVFRPKINFFLRGKPMLFGQKSPNFQVGIFHLVMSLGALACRKTPLGIIFKYKEGPDKEFSV